MVITRHLGSEALKGPYETEYQFLLLVVLFLNIININKPSQSSVPLGFRDIVVIQTSTRFVEDHEVVHVGLLGVAAGHHCFDIFKIYKIFFTF